MKIAGSRYIFCYTVVSQYRSIDSVSVCVDNNIFFFPDNLKNYFRTLSIKFNPLFLLHLEQGRLDVTMLRHRTCLVTTDKQSLPWLNITGGGRWRGWTQLVLSLSSSNSSSKIHTVEDSFLTSIILVYYLYNGWFQKISIAIPQAASWNSEGEGDFLDWNSEGIGG